MGRIRYQIIQHNGQDRVLEIHKKVFHKIYIDPHPYPYLMIEEPIYKWRQSDAGKFVIDNAITDSLEWQQQMDLSTYGHVYLVIAEMESKKLSEYYLKWGDPNGDC